MTPAMPTKDNNQAVWERSGLVSEYHDRSGLSGAETVMLDAFREDAQGKRILDIGCGGGRATADLLEIAGEYTGIDLSAGMVESCKARFADANLFQCDMRDLSIFGDGRFDLVLCNINCIDYVDHKGRLKVFDEVRRVLVDDGLFVFSTHNLNCEVSQASPRLKLSIRPHAMIRWFFEYLVSMLNHLRFRKKQVFNEGYALVNDGEAFYTLITYYIEKSCQVSQLESAGYTVLKITDENGVVLSDGDSDGYTPWLYYAARKNGPLG